MKRFICYKLEWIGDSQSTARISRARLRPQKVRETPPGDPLRDSTEQTTGKPFPRKKCAMKRLDVITY